MRVTKILAISGSLRAASINTTLLRAIARLAPAEVTVELNEDIGKIPLFNPDIESSDPPPVSNLRNSLIRADGVLIASPEYMA